MNCADKKFGDRRGNAVAGSALCARTDVVLFRRSYRADGRGPLAARRWSAACGGDGGIPGGRTGWRGTIAVVRAYVGVTDNSWYRFLADRPGVTEVNFWQPSGAREFRVLAPGEPFFFKTHYPHNKLVGGGFFSGSVRLPVSEAWEFFGKANGVASAEEMRARIGRYRRAPIGPGEDPVIGCLFVRDVRFFPADAIATRRRSSPATSCRARATTWPTRP